MEILGIYYIDFKDNLLDERNLYYHTKPNDLSYEEDSFYDIGYETIIEIL
jgi:hypothetical protein